MHTLPNTLRTINPYRATNLPPDAANEAISDWCWMDTILHPYDQRTLCEAGTPMTVNTYFVLQAAGVDQVRIAKIDWEAEDADLQALIDAPISEVVGRINDAANAWRQPAPTPITTPRGNAMRVIKVEAMPVDFDLELGPEDTFPVDAIPFDDYEF